MIAIEHIRRAITEAEANLLSVRDARQRIDAQADNLRGRVLEIERELADLRQALAFLEARAQGASR